MSAEESPDAALGSATNGDASMMIAGGLGCALFGTAVAMLVRSRYYSGYEAVKSAGAAHV